MFKRKLNALNYHNPDGFDVSNDAQLRNLVIWLEDQKIRHYKIEDRDDLRNSEGDKWQTVFKRYLTDLGYPLHLEENKSIVDWLLGYAVRLEYGDNLDKYKGVSAESSQSQQKATAKVANPLNELDFESPDFKAGVASLAKLMQIPPHPDHKVELKAICMVIKDRLNKQAIAKAQKEHGRKKPEKVMPLDQMILGFDAGDYISTEGAKILRLLHINDLRDLQTDINAAIVSVQAMTANPKTDTRLGKVGK